MSPASVQEPLPRSGRLGSEQFSFVVCQHGAEATVKRELMQDSGRFRLAFSRPGLLTFKFDESDSDLDLPKDWSIRQSGWVLGQCRGQQTTDLLAQVSTLLSGCDKAWKHCHVFQRDTALPGHKGFEPGPTALCDAIAQELRKLPALEQADFNHPAAFGAQVLDVLLVEPNHWLVGHHSIVSRYSAWPGGVCLSEPPPEMISRAYLKMSEAVEWSGLPLRSGDEIVEIGSSPGGASQRLLDLGLSVTGIDPAEMDPRLLGHPRFEHWRSKSSGVKRRLYSKFKWLAADANVAPNYTLDAVEDIVKYPTSRFQGLLLTLKLSSYEVAEHLPQNLDRIRSWGFERVEARQLASNRQECCVVAQRTA